jgi:hypothetical protein
MLTYLVVVSEGRHQFPGGSGGDELAVTHGFGCVLNGHGYGHTGMRKITTSSIRSRCHGPDSP